MWVSTFSFLGVYLYVCAFIQYIYVGTLLMIPIHIQGVRKLMVQTLTVGIQIPKTTTFSRISKSSKSRSFRDSES